MNELSPIARPPRQRKPDWIRVKAPTSAGFAETKRLMREKNLATVCEEAACPNIGECWTKKHATVMILGDTCTRACAFCNVKTGMPRAVDPLEPEHVAEVAVQMGLAHIVITSVDRDDLPDVDQAARAGTFVEVVYILRHDQQVAGPFGVEPGERTVRCVGLDAGKCAAALVVEAVDRRSVSRQRLGRADVLDAVAFPQAVGAAEGREAAFGGDAGTGQDDD